MNDASFRAVCADGTAHTLHPRATFESALPDRRHHSGRRFRILTERGVYLHIEFLDTGERFEAFPEEVAAGDLGYPVGASTIRTVYAEAHATASHRIFLIEFACEWMLELSEGFGGPIVEPPDQLVLLGSRVIRADGNPRLYPLYRRSFDGGPDVGMIRSAARSFVDAF